MRAENLAAELGQPEVVTDVGVSEEDAVEQRRVRHSRRGFLHRAQLRREVRRRVDDPALTRLRIDDGQRRYTPAQFRIAPRSDAIRTIASRLRIAAVLRDAED